MIETHMMSIEVDLTNGKTLVLNHGDSKELNIQYLKLLKNPADHPEYTGIFTMKQHFMSYTEENRLWCIAERRRLNRMMIVKDARIVHKTIKT